MSELICALQRSCSAVLLANHGPVVSGPDLEAARYAAEELEETAKLALLLNDTPVRELTAAEITDLAAECALW